MIFLYSFQPSRRDSFVRSGDFGLCPGFPFLNRQTLIGRNVLDSLRVSAERSSRGAPEPDAVHESLTGLVHGSLAGIGVARENRFGLGPEAGSPADSGPEEDALHARAVLQPLQQAQAADAAQGHGHELSRRGQQKAPRADRLVDAPVGRVPEPCDAAQVGQDVEDSGGIRGEGRKNRWSARRRRARRAATSPAPSGCRGRRLFPAPGGQKAPSTRRGCAGTSSSKLPARGGHGAGGRPESRSRGSSAPPGRRAAAGRAKRGWPRRAEWSEAGPRGAAAAPLFRTAPASGTGSPP